MVYQLAMAATTVRVLGEGDWQEYRAIRLAALQDAPDAFASTYAEESQLDEPTWRSAMVRAHRLLALRGPAAVGVVSVGPVADEEESADLFGLWVAPEVRNTGVAWRLVEAAAQQAVRDGSTRLYYWVSTENGRAVAFATNFGFRVTSQRRTARVSHTEFGDQEVAFVLSLASDAGVPNPTGPRLRAQPGPR
jgi:ribosomal protein S18 acetylase RimI-like enzyme